MLVIHMISVHVAFSIKDVKQMYKDTQEFRAERRSFGHAFANSSSLGSSAGMMFVWFHSSFMEDGRHGVCGRGHWATLCPSTLIISPADQPKKKLG